MFSKIPNGVLNPSMGWNTTGSRGGIGPRGAGAGCELGEGAPTATDPKPNATRKRTKARNARTKACTGERERATCAEAEKHDGRALFVSQYMSERHGVFDCT